VTLIVVISFLAILFIAATAITGVFVLRRQKDEALRVKMRRDTPIPVNLEKKFHREDP
jgi:hypothetical protein